MRRKITCKLLVFFSSKSGIELIYTCQGFFCFQVYYLDFVLMNSFLRIFPPSFFSLMLSVFTWLLPLVMRLGYALLSEIIHTWCWNLNVREWHWVLTSQGTQRQFTPDQGWQLSSLCWGVVCFIQFMVIIFPFLIKDLGEYSLKTYKQPIPHQITLILQI